MKRRKKVKIKTRKPESLFLRVFLVAFLLAVSIGVIRQWTAYEEVREQQALILADISKEEERRLEYENQKEYYNSDSYIEQIARDQLGMIKPNEVLYINRGQ